MPLSISDRNKLQAVSQRSDVALLGLFGSFANGDATSESNVDVLVRFVGRKSLLDLVRVERAMSEAIGRKVDLLTEASLSPHLRDHVLSGMIVLHEGAAT